MLVLSVFVLTGCGEKQEDKKEEAKGLVGQWAYSTSFVYTFNEDKTGDYSGKKFTYEDNGTEISITYEGNTSPLVLKYRIEGNKLIVTDSFGKDVEYVKK